MALSRHRLSGQNPGQPAAFFALVLLGSSLLSLGAPASAALPGEPTVEVRLTPTESQVDTSGINPVDTSFLVNVTGSNIGLRPHTMWVNITFGTSTGWKVVPPSANLTLSLAARSGTETQTVSVTVTVPPRISANLAATFFASYREENTLEISTGQTGNATAQLTIRPIYSTSAEFANGTSQLQMKQGEDVNLSVRVTNRGNGDARYDAQLLNAADLRPSDILLQSTTPADIAQNGSGVVRLVLHANRAAIAGTYALQVRVLATSASAPPPAGAYADLTAQLKVLPSASPPPSGNNSTQPPPQANNTSAPPTINPPPTNPSFIDVIVTFVSTPTGLGATAVLVVVLVLASVLVRARRRAKRKRAAALERARQKHQGPGLPGVPGVPAKPVGPGARPIRPQRVVQPHRPLAPPSPRGPPAK